MFLSLGLELLQTSSFLHCTKNNPWIIGDSNYSQESKIQTNRNDDSLKGFRTANHALCIQMTFTSTRGISWLQWKVRMKNPSSNQNSHEQMTWAVKQVIWLAYWVISSRKQRPFEFVVARCSSLCKSFKPTLIINRSAVSILL